MEDKNGPVKGNNCHRQTQRVGVVTVGKENKKILSGAELQREEEEELQKWKMKRTIVANQRNPFGDFSSDSSYPPLESWAGVSSLQLWVT